MERRKNKIRWIKWGVVGCFILVQIYLLFMNRHMTMGINAGPNNKPTPRIMGDREIGQSFVPKRNHLAQIQVLMGTFGRENDKDVIFQLWDIEPPKKMILQKVFNASTVKKLRFHSLKFTPQKNSRGKEYYFSLSSPESTPGNSICAWMNTQDIYGDGQYFFNNRTSEGDLVFRTYSLQPVSAVLGKINENYPGIWGSQLFLILTVIFFLVLEVAVLVKLFDIGHQYVSEFWE